MVGSMDGGMSAMIRVLWGVAKPGTAVRKVKAGPPAVDPLLQAITDLCAGSDATQEGPTRDRLRGAGYTTMG